MAKSESGGFMKALKPSEALAKITGSEAMPRTQVTKALWDYIKKKGLQEKTNKRMVNTDEILKPIFGGKDQVSMFEMTGLVAKHLS